MVLHNLFLLVGNNGHDVCFKLSSPGHKDGRCKNSTSAKSSKVLKVRSVSQASSGFNEESVLFFRPRMAVAR